ncbi:MAG: hypothetical protein KF833_12825 [Verrucomicrobiae bacterium]|nr:hypothetical protein [Verrucomicrobiae bacterium]
MIAVVIVGALASISIPLYNKFTFDARVSEATELLVAAYKEQQMVAEAVAAGRYPGWPYPYTELFETTRVNTPTLSLRPKGNERFNLIIGERELLISGRKAFSDFPGMGALPKQNDYGFRTGTGRFMMGAEAIIDGNLHAMAIDDQGKIWEICDARGGGIGQNSTVFVSIYGAGAPPDCTAP